MLRIVVALPCEAKPLIAHYRLREVSSSDGFRIYRKEETFLVISGVGKTAVAAATAYLHLFSGAKRGVVWLNVGVAGHGGEAIGRGLLARRIQDQATARDWHLPRLIDPPCPTGEILTVDRPCADYVSPWLYEMEASAYYPTARRFSMAGLVHCYKVVSDNFEGSVDRVNRRLVSGLIQENLSVIDKLLEKLFQRALEVPAIGADPSALKEPLSRHAAPIQKPR